MDWKLQLQSHVSNKEFQQALKLLRQETAKHPDDVKATVMLLYLLHNLLIEEDLLKLGYDHDALANELLTQFRSAQERFNDDPVFLFFVGIILHIAEWYFGQDDVSLALRMQKRATEIEPDNILFQFSYLFSLGEQKRAVSLAKKLMIDEECLQWLRSYGFAGDYVVELIQSTASDKLRT